MIVAYSYYDSFDLSFWYVRNIDDSFRKTQKQCLRKILIIMDETDVQSHDHQLLCCYLGIVNTTYW